MRGRRRHPADPPALRARAGRHPAGRRRRRAARPPSRRPRLVRSSGRLPAVPHRRPAPAPARPHPAGRAELGRGRRPGGRRRGAPLHPPVRPGRRPAPHVLPPAARQPRRARPRPHLLRLPAHRARPPPPAPRPAHRRRPAAGRTRRAYRPGGDVLGNDRALDAWIAAHLTTAVHLCGSAALGRVVDADLRVLGVDGLRVADTSVLPTVPRRGPAATAVAIGEKAAALLASSS
ncbi:MAG: hypothetical protein JOY78_14815 [Pseudonocardia sp.]|nr:hypothetical protein [Pseudonocardia sp.]